MSSTFFVDTGILLAARDASEPSRQACAHQWMVDLWRRRSGRLSFQVLEEFYVAVTQVLDPGLPPEIAREEVRNLLAWRPLRVDGPLLEGAWGIQTRYRLSFRRATIVAAAQLAGCGFLLSDRFQQGRRFDGVEVVHPFEHLSQQGSMVHDSSTLEGRR